MAFTVRFGTITPARVHLRLDNPDLFSVGSVTRQDVNGTRSVRTPTGQLPSAAPSIDIYDFEYAPAYPGAVTYSVYSAAGALLGGASYTVTTTLQHVVWITCPLYPSNSFEVSGGDLGPATSFVTTWDSTRAGRSTPHQVLGRSDPVVVLRHGETRRGTMSMVCPDRLAAKRVEDQLSLPNVWQLRQSDVPGLDLYFTVESVQIRNIEASSGPRWDVALGFVEVNWPPGPFTPSNVWTYADVLAAYGDYNAVASSFASYATLLDKDPLP
jgi:hypothetical protein